MSIKGAPLSRTLNWRVSSPRLRWGSLTWWWISSGQKYMTAFRISRYDTGNYYELLLQPDGVVGVWGQSVLLVRLQQLLWPIRCIIILCPMRTPCPMLLELDQYLMSPRAASMSRQSLSSASTATPPGGPRRGPPLTGLRTLLTGCSKGILT